MTTLPVQPISDEQLAEIERGALGACSYGLNDWFKPSDLEGPFDDGDRLHIATSRPHAILGLIARLKAAEVETERSIMRVRELDLLFGRYLLGMKAAVIEMDHGRGATAGMQWIISGLEGPGELPSEDEVDAQEFFDREITPINDAMAALYQERKAAMERTK